MYDVGSHCGFVLSGGSEPESGSSDRCHTHTRLTVLCPGLPGWASTGKVKTNLDFTEVRDIEWQWHQLGRMQVCNSLQTDNHASTPPLIFYWPDALPAAQPSVSKDKWYIMNLMHNELRLNLWGITVDEIVRKRWKWHHVWCWEPLWFCPLRWLWAWVWLFWQISVSK